MLPDKDIRCPATAFKRSCRDIVTEHKCPKWISIKGTHPQSGEIVDNWGCVDTFLPMLLIENAQQQRQTGAAVESFRNETFRANQAVADAFTRMAGNQPRALPQS